MKFKPESPLSPRKLQAEQITQVQAHTSSLLAKPLGSGKTLISVEAVRTKQPDAQVLVIAPRNTLYGWERTVRRQYQQYDDGLVRRIDSTPKGKMALEDFWKGVTGWYLVTWQWYALREQGYWDKSPADVMILDEVQRMQNRDSKSWKNVRNTKVENKIAMSGTFTGNRLSGGWTTLRWLWPENEDNSLYTTPRSYWRWVADWLTQDYDEWIGFTKVGGERFEEGTMLSYYPNYIYETDLSEVPPVNEIIVDVPLTGKQRALYKQFNKELMAWLSTPDPETGLKPMVATIPAVKRMRLRDITLGELIIDADDQVTYDWKTMKSSKYDMILDIIENELDDDETLLVLTHSRRWALAVTDKLNDAGYNTYPWVGGTREASRQNAVERWGQPGGPRIIVATIKAIAEGTDGLQYMCNNEVWASEEEDAIMNVQAKKRLPRTGQTKTVNRWVLVAPDTYDQGILDKQLENMLSLNRSLKTEETNG